MCSARNIARVRPVETRATRQKLKNTHVLSAREYQLRNELYRTSVVERCTPYIAITGHSCLWCSVLLYSLTTIFHFLLVSPKCMRIVVLLEHTHTRIMHACAHTQTESLGQCAAGDQFFAYCNWILACMTSCTNMMRSFSLLWVLLFINISYLLRTQWMAWCLGELNVCLHNIRHLFRIIVLCWVKTWLYVHVYNKVISWFKLMCSKEINNTLGQHSYIHKIICI